MKLLFRDYLPDASAPEDIELAGGLMAGPEFCLLNEDNINEILERRQTFSHKGSYGHALIVAGATETMGAALLAASGSIHAGAGLTTACIPESGLTALNTLLPEAMFISRKGLGDPGAFGPYNSILLGPGMKLTGSLSAEDASLLESLGQLLERPPMVIDAEAINRMAKDKDMFNLLSRGNILTPHVKEFDRLFGAHDTWWQRVRTALDVAETHECIIVLKNRYTLIALPGRRLLVNPSGNPAMAQGGMGDVLGGVIAGYLAQGYSTSSAAVLGCYFHGRAGDDLAKKRFNVTASQVAAQIPKTVRKFLKEH